MTTAPHASAATDRIASDSLGKAVIVGGGRGIGAAIAETLSQQPWVDHVVVADIDRDAAADVAADLRDVRAEGIEVDITSGEAIASLVAETHDAQYVAVAAGIFSASSALETPREDFERILAVNLIGVYGVAQAYAQQMTQKHRGAIVGVASIAATLPRMRQAAYCASKAGMRQALRVLGMEVAAHGIRVNTVSPGPTDTPMMRELAQDHPDVDYLAAGSPDALRPPIPIRRVARPEDIAAAAAFLLSPQAKHVTLRDLVVDGGELLGV